MKNDRLTVERTGRTDGRTDGREHWCLFVSLLTPVRRPATSFDAQQTFRGRVVSVPRPPSQHVPSCCGRALACRPGRVLGAYVAMVRATLLTMMLVAWLVGGGELVRACCLSRSDLIVFGSLVPCGEVFHALQGHRVVHLR